jgi:predicted esterase
MEMVITAVLEESDLSRSALVLAGFSQGAAMAMVLAARGAARGGRLIVSSGWIPEGPGIDIDLADCGVASALVQLSSGDEVVAPELTRWSADALERSGCVVDVVEYPGPHDMTELRYRDAGAWMTSR